jgi:hypothetical protein
MAEDLTVRPAAADLFDDAATLPGPESDDLAELDLPRAVIVRGRLVHRRP